MTNITLSIEEEVYKKMKKHSEIRWSEFVRKIIKNRINDLETIEKSKDKESILNMLASESVKKIGIIKWMKGGIMYNQKDIVLLPFSYSDLTGSKQRPALIISNEKVNKTRDRICCLITSNQPEEAIEIKKEHFNEGKLPFQSWIKPYRLFSINERIITKKICSINEKFHTRILKEINECLK